MPTCRDIISYGLKMARVIPAGVEPDADESADGLFAMQGMFEGWVADGMFGRLTDVYETASYTAEEGQRIFLSVGTLTIPTTFDDNRRPRDLSIIEGNVAGVRSLYLYEAGRGVWVEIHDLTLDDEAPLATRGRDGLAACVAERWGEMFGNGGDLTTTITKRAFLFKQSLSHALGSTRDRLSDARDWF